VDVILESLWEVGIDDVCNALDVQTARGDVCRDQHADLGAGEVGQSRLPVVLLGQDQSKDFS
jgi:hypothetical protein